jgi:hypothetical protein
MEWKINDTYSVAKWTHSRSRRDTKKHMHTLPTPPMRIRLQHNTLYNMQDISEYEKVFTLTINLVCSKPFLLGYYTCIAKRGGKEISTTYKLK